MAQIEVFHKIYLDNGQLVWERMRSSREGVILYRFNKDTSSESNNYSANRLISKPVLSGSDVSTYPDVFGTEGGKKAYYMKLSDNWFVFF